MANKSDMQESLNNAQSDAINHILNNFSQGINTLCLLDTGMGKTRIACAVLKSLMPQIIEEKSYALIFYKQKESINNSWEKELELVNVKYEILTGKNFSDFVLESDGNKFYPHDKKVYLLSYELLSSLYAPLSKSVDKDNFDEITGKKRNDGKIRKVSCFIQNPPYFIVFDEWHRITNGSNLKDKSSRIAIQKLPVQRRLALTATATVNKPDEIEISKKVLNEGQEISELSADKFIFKGENNDKEKILNFKPHRFIIDVPLRNDEKEAIKKYNVPNIRNAVALENILLIGKHKGITLNAPTTKVLALRKILETLTKDDKAIILDSYIPQLRYLAEQEWMKPFSPVICHGRIDQDTRTNNMKRFKEDPECRVLLATDKLAGESLNLQNANHLIDLTIGWTPMGINQITGRINRPEQENDTFCYIITCNRNPSNDGFINLNDARRLETIEKKNEEQKEFLAANELDKYVRKNFSYSENFEKEFQAWLTDTLSPTNRKIQKKKKQTNDRLEKRRLLIKKVIDNISQKQMLENILWKGENLLAESIFGENEKNRAIKLLKNYNLKYEWKSVKEICKNYLDDGDSIFTNYLADLNTLLEKNSKR